MKTRTNPAGALLEVSLEIPREHVAQLEDHLERLGALSVTLADPGEHPVEEPGAGETPLWPVVRVSALFSCSQTPSSLLAAVRLAPGPDAPRRITARRVEDQPWERAWLDDFQPMRFGRDLWIVPSHHEPPQPDGVNLRLDPGLAFGTGTHATTRLCLEWIDGTGFEGRSALDYGCGSGVLGIAAALKGARRVVCVDQDPQALRAARKNARRNGAGRCIRTVDAAQYRPEPFDVVMANILSSTLIELAPVLGASVKPGGQLVMSGILADQARSVSAAYGDRFSGWRQAREGEWVLLAGSAGDWSGWDLE